MIGRAGVAVRLLPQAVNAAPERVRDQAYRLAIGPDGVTLAASHLAGFRYGLQTLERLIRDCPRGLPCVTITDWPDFPARGVMLDISRDKVPTMASLESLVRRLASWRANQLQLYIEHAYAYRGHERVWRGASPMTASQLRRLDKLCRDHGIELVPNQNSLGHMERWLRHEDYAPLAECNGPYKTPWGETRTRPTTLNPVDPRSIRLVASLYEQLLPNFTSAKLNVGCDEPFELGQGRSLAACERRGAVRVYFDYLMKIRRIAARHGRRIQFWSDWIQRDPELIDKLPRDVVPLVWGYEGDHPFDAECHRIAQLGLTFYVCPGTSSWCSFAGRTSNMISNLRGAAEAGIRHRAAGFLVTDWGDFGHRQMPAVSDAAFLYGAAVSWCVSTNRDIRIEDELSREVYHDRTGRLARAWLEAGQVHESSGVQLKNKTVLFAAMQSAIDEIRNISGLRAAAVRRMRERVRRIRRDVRSARPTCGDGALVISELAFTLDLLEHACDRIDLALRGPRRGALTKEARRLADQMRSLIQRYEKLWRMRNRPGGLADSRAHFERNLDEYRRLGQIDG